MRETFKQLNIKNKRVCDGRIYKKADDPFQEYLELHLQSYLFSFGHEYLPHLYEKSEKVCGWRLSMNDGNTATCFYPVTSMQSDTCFFQNFAFIPL